MVSSSYPFVFMQPADRDFELPSSLWTLESSGVEARGIDYQQGTSHDRSSGAGQRGQTLITGHTVDRLESVNGFSIKSEPIQPIPYRTA